MRAYLDLLQGVLDTGIDRGDRTGVGTRSLFGKQLRFNLSQGFPLVTTKRLYTKAIVHELLWFLKGDTNISYLNANGIPIWDEWADAVGNLGPIYGKQWRSWEGADGSTFDQIAEVVTEIKRNPNSRRLVVSAWNVADLPKMRLAPCHCLFQFYVAEGRLSCQLYQRSADLFIGVPFNIASYALLTHLIAQECGLLVGDFVHTFGDVHIYRNHFEQARLQLSRTLRPLPQLALSGKPSLFNLKAEDIIFVDYNPHPPIFAKVAV